VPNLAQCAQSVESSGLSWIGAEQQRQDVAVIMITVRVMRPSVRSEELQGEILFEYPYYLAQRAGKSVDIKLSTKMQNIAKGVSN
jgi:hypothetical protein